MRKNVMSGVSEQVGLSKRDMSAAQLNLSHLMPNNLLWDQS